jgi:hypothetical protein
VVLLLLAFGWARAEAQSAQPIEDPWVPNGTVSPIAAGGGRVYVGGSFDATGYRHVGGSVTSIAGTACSGVAASVGGGRARDPRGDEITRGADGPGVLT